MHSHPSFAEQYIRQREHELARSAARYGPHLTGRKQPRRPLRYRIGWRLIEIGLTLAQRSAVEVP
jgi:hypothetical protein